MPAGIVYMIYNRTKRLGCYQLAIGGIWWTNRSKNNGIEINANSFDASLFSCLQQEKLQKLSRNPLLHLILFEELVLETPT